jgi:DNA polymerase-1
MFAQTFLSQETFAMSSRPLFYILDGHSLAYRHYFAQISRPLMTARGEGTSAVFGFARMLMDILEKEQPYYLAVSFDDGLSGRDELYPDYKGTREKMPDDLHKQIGRIMEIVQAFNVPILMEPGCEADDLMGTVSRRAEAQGVDVMIFTGDRDLLQLLTENIRVRLFVPQANVPDDFYDIPRFREKYGLEPPQLIDLKALEGDTSDNIPGVPGIGRKGATTLLQQFGTLENIYASLDQVKSAIRVKLEAGYESALLSQKLATIHRDMPVKFDLTQCVAHDFDRHKVEVLFRELEFTSLFNQLGRLAIRSTEQLPLFHMHDIDVPLQTPVAPATALFPTIIVQDETGLRALVNVLNGAQAISFDVETTGTDQITADLVGISLSVDGETGYYIPVMHTEGAQLPLETIISAIRPALTNPNIPKYAHNANYDLIMMQRYGIDVKPITFDTMIAEWVRDPLNGNLGLKRLAAAELSVHMTPITELIGTGKNQIQMSHVPIESAAPYAAADAVATYKLVDVIREKLLRQDDDPDVDALWGTPNPPDPIDVFNTLEIPLIPVLADMEMAGVLLDTDFLRVMSVGLNDMLRKLEEEVFELSGGFGNFNINSPKQLNEVLFGKLGLKAQGIRKTAHGVSTAADVLDNMRGEHPIIDKILQFRELSKLKGTYVDALPALINPRTGRVHTNYNQAGSATGRMSSSNPNLQNIPIRTEVGREVRRAFIVPDGICLLSVDYSQVELRIMAHITREPALLEAFAQGQDIHAATAATVYNVPIETVTKSQRNFAKRVNFGLLYGMGAHRLARESDLTYAQAEDFINTYFERLPGVRAYLDKAKQLAYQKGYLTTLFGRRRFFPGLTHGNHNTRATAEREAINMPIQGTAADIIKKAMIALHSELQRRKTGARMILQVHDELVLEVPERELQDTAALVVRTMEDACDLAAPLRTSAQYGTNWRDLEPVPL